MKYQFNKKPHFEPSLGLLGPNLGYNFFFFFFFFFEVSALFQAAILCNCAISRKTNNANLRKWQKTYFRATHFFSWVLPLLVVVSTYHPMQLGGKLMNQPSEKGKKPKLGPDFGMFDLNLGPQKYILWFYSNRC